MSNLGNSSTPSRCSKVFAFMASLCDLLTQRRIFSLRRLITLLPSSGSGELSSFSCVLTWGWLIVPAASWAWGWIWSSACLGLITGSWMRVSWRYSPGEHCWSYVVWCSVWFWFWCLIGAGGRASCNGAQWQLCSVVGPYEFCRGCPSDVFRFDMEFNNGFLEICLLDVSFKLVTFGPVLLLYCLQRGASCIRWECGEIA